MNCKIMRDKCDFGWKNKNNNSNGKKSYFGGNLLVFELDQIEFVLEAKLLAILENP